MIFEFTWWLMFTIPVALVLESLLHEASHIIAGMVLENARLVTWHPWPGYVKWEEQGMEKRQWAWAWYRLEATDQSQAHWMRHAAPAFAGIALACGTLIIVKLFTDSEVYSAFLPFVICGAGDGLLFLYTCIFGTEVSDGKKFRKIKGAR